MFAHTQREAVRVKVKKCEANVPPEWRKFSVDPQITSLEVLYSLLAKAFEIKSDFSIKYKAFDPAGNEIYLAVLSDWDLDAAFLRIHNLSIQTATEPCLMLQIDIKPFTEVREWEADTTNDANGDSSNVMLNTKVSSGGATPKEIISPLQQSIGVSQKYVQHVQNKLPGLIMNQMEKTFSMVQKAFNLSEETMASLPPRPPLSDNEFRLFLDALGQIQRSDDLRKVIFFGGIDSSLRRVVWKHILNVYPGAMNGHQRMTYMRRKSEHYYKLRDTWKTAVKQGCIVDELSYVTGMVKKDVLRTDRLHPFYAGSDDNQNIAALFNILTTYALNHPSVSYCQGMSDIASPLLVTMNDEAQAYICFCAIMSRVRGNFMLDGIAMTQKFAHLTEALSFYDPEFWDYLKSQQADDLLFCYRWLLLELKREFPFDDALRMLEVQWSSLKYDTSVDRELNLFEKEFVPIQENVTSSATSTFGNIAFCGTTPTSPSYLTAKPRENPYTKVCALRRQSSAASLNSFSSSMSNSINNSMSSIASVNKLDTTRRLNQSLDDNISRHAARRQRRVSSKAHQSLDETKMLALMESIECKKNLSNNGRQQCNDIINSRIENSNASEKCNTVDDDDDVFMPSNTNSNNPMPSTGKTPNENKSFNFHHTNPFAEDAQVNEKIIEMHCGGGDNMSNNESELKTKLTQIPRGIAKLQNKNILSNYNTVSNIIAKQLANASNVGESMKRVSNSGGGHFKDLKEKIAASKGMAFEDINSINDKSQQKIVKNFNEFLTFASINKSRIADRFNSSTIGDGISSYTSSKDSKSPTHILPKTLQSTNATQNIVNTTGNPLVQLTKSGLGSSLDDSDSSSLPDTTWSGSTAATAIQQLNTLSNHSLHLELNSSLSSTTLHTPERTPIHDGRLTADGDKQLTQPTQQYSNATISIFDVNSTPDDAQDQGYYPMTTAITRELRLESENLDRQVFGDTTETENKKSYGIGCEIEYEKLDKDSLDLMEELKENEIVTCPDISELLQRRRNRDAARIKSTLEPLHRLFSNTSNSSRTEIDSWGEQATPNSIVSSCFSDESSISNQIDGNSNSIDDNQLQTEFASVKINPNPFLDESLLLDDSADVNKTIVGIPLSNSLPEVLVPISTITAADASSIEMATSAAAADAAEIALSKSPQKLTNGIVNADITATATVSGLPPMLPPPNEFGGGNPFLMFLCLTLLLQHRNTIIKSGMDYNEIAMHFDKMVRKHDVTRVLNQARRMYIDYLKVQSAYRQQMQSNANTISSISGDINKNSNLNGSASSSNSNAANIPYNTQKEQQNMPRYSQNKSYNNAATKS